VNVFYKKILGNRFVKAVASGRADGSNYPQVNWVALV